jgi:GR25 family glycosyltransferase involved in LPS biosynthesis
MKKYKFYVIHNLDKRRKKKILEQLTSNGVATDDIKFINHPNKNELTYEIKKEAVQKNTKINNKVIKDGWISVSYKHYLALKDIVDNDIEYGVVIEDNVGTIGQNIYERIDSYMRELPKDWDIVFESDQRILNYNYTNEGSVNNNKLLYKKNNDITYREDGSVILHGGSRSAQFYFLSNSCAKKLYEHYLPFNHAPDMWMNDLFRKLDIKSFWAEPTFIKTEVNHKTSTNQYLIKDFKHIIKSKFINLRLGL